jgi:polysaccharide export outer membrane protein
MRHLRPFSLLRLALALGGLALPPSGAVEAQLPPPAAATAVTLQPGDLVRILIWREEDLSGEFLVDEDGTVTLPLIGEKQVTRIPLMEVRDSLVADYRVHLRNPAIIITPLRRIHMLGEVNKPGVYAVDPTVSLAGAVAIAEGATPSGDLRKISIWRAGRVLRERVAPGETLTNVDIRSGDQIIVERRSWVERNSTFVVSALLSVTSVVISLISR